MVRLRVMVRILHHLLVVLTALAFLGGATLQAMPVEKAQTMPVMQANMPCDQMAGMMQNAHPGGQAPCKGVTPECIKQMGCIGIPSLPSGHTLSTPVNYATIRYSQPQQRLQSVSLEPDLFPPIAV